MWDTGGDWRQSGATSPFPPSVPNPWYSSFPLGFSPAGTLAAMLHYVLLFCVFSIETYIYCIAHAGTPWMVEICSTLGPAESQYTGTIPSGPPRCQTRTSEEIFQGSRQHCSKKATVHSVEDHWGLRPTFFPLPKALLDEPYRQHLF